MSDPVMAELRDASWYSRPDTRAPKRYHVMMDDGRPACGGAMFLVEPVPAERVPEPSRCKRPGCISRWPSPAGEV